MPVKFLKIDIFNDDISTFRNIYILTYIFRYFDIFFKNIIRHFDMSSTSLQISQYIIYTKTNLE